MVSRIRSVVGINATRWAQDRSGTMVDLGIQDGRGHIIRTNRNTSN